MRKTRIVLAVVAFIWLAAPLLADEHETPPPMIVAKSHFVTVEPGKAVAFEAAYKEHIAFHAENNDTWYWHTWLISNGQNFGQYIIRTGNHTWADFDNRGDFAAEDFTHYLEQVAPHVKKVSSVLVVSAPEITKWPDDYGMPSMVEVNVFQISHEYGDAFYDAMKKVHEAMVEKEMPFTYSWSWIANGAEGVGQPWVLVFPFNSWEEYGKGFEPKFWKMVEEVHGEYQTGQIRKIWAKAIAHQESFIAEYRADMSYNPPE